LPRNHAPLRGYLMIAGATLLWAISANVGRALFTGRLLASDQLAHPISALQLSQVRASVSTLVLGSLLLWRRGLRPLILSRGDTIRCLILGAAGLAGSNFLYYYAMQTTSVASAIIVQYTAPAWVLLWVSFAHRQWPSLPKVGGVLLAILGCALVVGVIGGGGLHGTTLGLLAVLLASFSFAFYSVFGHDLLRRFPEGDRWLVVFYAFMGAALLWAFVNPPWRLFAQGYSGRQWVFLVLFALGSSLGPFALYFLGLQYVDATSAIVTCTLEPVMSILLAAALLGESLGAMQVAGVAVVLSAILLVQLQGRTEAPLTVD